MTVAGIESRRLTQVLPILLCALAAGCSREEPPRGIEDVQAASGKPVETVTVARGNIETWITVAGTVEGAVQYPVVSQNSLPVTALPRREGERVRAGDVVVRLAQQAPSPMYLSYERTRALLDDARRDLERARRLHAEGAISQQELDKADMAVRVQEADLRDAGGSLDLVALRSGVLTRLLVETGETVDAGKPVAWIADTDSVLVKFDAGSRQAAALARGQPVRWRAPDGSVREGKLVSLELSADPVTHLRRGEAGFGNADGALVPGLLVDLQVRTGRRAAALLVPAAALVATAGGGTELFVAEPDRSGGFVARRRAVQTGLAATDTVEVLAGLAEGDLVVLHGQSRLAEGERVNVLAADGSPVAGGGAR